MPSRVKILGRIEEFPASGLKQVEVAGKKILLICRDNEITAIDGTCPHAGAPLSEGVLYKDSVICPWHKAAFAAGSGKCVEPPAVDDLPAYKIEIVDGDIILSDEEPDAPLGTAAQDDKRCFVIIGAGAAGFSAAQELRRQNFSGRIILLDAIGALPYDRTIQSKYVLSGTEAGEKALYGTRIFITAKISSVVRAQCQCSTPRRKKLPYWAAKPCPTTLRWSLPVGRCRSCHFPALASPAFFSCAASKMPRKLLR